MRVHNYICAYLCMLTVHKHTASYAAKAGKLSNFMRCYIFN